MGRDVPELANHDWLRDQYIDQRRSIETIARVSGATIGQVRRAIAAAEIELRRSLGNRRRRLHDSTWLYQRHVVDDVPVTEIAADLELPDTDVWAAMVRFGVPLRRWAP